MKDFLFPMVIMFLTSLAVIETLLYAYRAKRKSNPSKIRKRLETLKLGGFEKGVPNILRRRVMSNVPVLNKILNYVPGVRTLDNLIVKANAQYPPGVFILFAAVLSLLGFFVSNMLLGNLGISILIAALLSVIPFIYLNAKKNRRMQKFEKQLPEGLDLIARALKAGHAFNSGMHLVVDQFDDPLGTEFDMTIDEINFGVSVSDALINLSSRVDCQDLKYFVVSVILQRETGGNLSEILENIAHIIRERFKFQDKLKTLSAEGRYSAVILGILPFVVVAMLSFVNPNYLKILLNEPVGTLLLISAGVMMLVGAIVMKKLINIKV